jgi:acetyl esterase/lipase
MTNRFLSGSAVRLLFGIACGLASCVLWAQTTASARPSASGEAAAWAAEAETRYQFLPNVSYLTAGNVELRMDIYSRRDLDTPQPTLVFFHGGFWMRGSKDAQLLALLPWLEKGWNVVNVGYRLGDAAIAPAAVIDAFCALRFLTAHAETYRIDPERIVTSGQSAGGHLALSAAMLADEGYDSHCPEGQTPKVAAVINWYGVTDVPDVIDGANASEIAAGWFGGMAKPDAMMLAGALSPLNHVRNGLPPILSIQGDADAIVPYSHGTRLHEALRITDTAHELITVPEGGHGRFSAEQRRQIYQSITRFLIQIGLE